MNYIIIPGKSFQIKKDTSFKILKSKGILPSKSKGIAFYENIKSKGIMEIQESSSSQQTVESKRISFWLNYSIIWLNYSIIWVFSILFLIYYFTT